jgi:hypothetical protein
VGRLPNAWKAVTAPKKGVSKKKRGCPRRKARMASTEEEKENIGRKVQW